MLNIQRTGSEDYGRHIKALICGYAGSGKTLISSTFPNPFFVSAEGGLMSLAERDIPYVKVPEPGTKISDTLLTLKMRLEQSPDVRAKQFGFPVDTVIIDTIDEISRLLLREKMTAEKHDSAELKDYGWLKEQMGGFVTGLRNLDINVVFTCHLKTYEITDGLTGLIPAIEGGFSQRMAEYVDLAVILKSNLVTKVVGHDSVRVIERYMQCFPDPKTEWVKDRSNKLPQELPVNFVDDYDRIAKLIWGKIPKVGKAKTPAVTEPETVVDPEDLVTSSAPSAQDTGTPVDAKKDVFTCEDCNQGFSDEDQHDRSQIRYHAVVCLPCFNKRGQKKSA